MELALGDRLKDSWKQTKKQLGAFEKRARHRVDAARDRVEAVPKQLRGACERAFDRARASVSGISRDELRQIGRRIDDLAKKVDRLTKERVARVSDKVAGLARK